MPDPWSLIRHGLGPARLSPACRRSLGAIRNKQEEQNEDDEKHNGPLRVVTKHVHRDNLLQDGMGAATCGYSPVDAGGC